MSYSMGEGRERTYDPEEREKNTKMLPPGSHKLTAVVSACSGPAEDWTC